MICRFIYIFAIMNEGLDIDIIRADDFFREMPEVPKQTVYSRIRAKERRGELYSVGHGMYSPVKKLKYRLSISDWMTGVNSFLIENAPGIDFCLMEKERNLIVEASRRNISIVAECLKTMYNNIIVETGKSRIDYHLEGAIIVRPMVSESPLMETDGIKSPSLEKSMVDMLVSEQGAAGDYFQRAFELYQVNLSRLTRYAKRRSVEDKLQSTLMRLDSQRIDLMGKIQLYFSSQPIDKAWLFGSFARGEEKEDSDIDILVQFDKDFRKTMGLLQYIAISNGLKDITGREIDLVEDGKLKPFAVPSAEKDKILIYER